MPPPRMAIEVGTGGESKDDDDDELLRVWRRVKLLHFASGEKDCRRRVRVRGFNECIGPFEGGMFWW
jgi:hypothetical protein